MCISVYAILILLDFGIQAKSIHELVGLNITELVTALGYPIEIHEIETKDGYLLDLHRIPYGVKTLNGNPNKNPVILHHGLQGCAENFIWMGPGKSLAFLLADSGYDVWMMNDRGTMHSRKHRNLNPDIDEVYWRFTFHEIGVYDITASIDYILNTTKKSKLHYVGHSQGISTLLVMGSEQPKYNEKINIVIAMAPAVFTHHMTQRFFKFLSQIYKSIEIFTENSQIHEIPPFGLRKFLIHFVQYSCTHFDGPNSLCRYAIGIGGKIDPNNFDRRLFPIIFPTLLTGCSTKQIAHYGQVTQTGNIEKLHDTRKRSQFAQFDWGAEENERRYKNAKISNYNLKNVRFPIGIFFGSNDSLITEKDVNILASLLPNVVENSKVEDYSHLDFLWANNLYSAVNRRVMEVMKLYGYIV